MRHHHAVLRGREPRGQAERGVAGGERLLVARPLEEERRAVGEDAGAERAPFAEEADGQRVGRGAELGGPRGIARHQRHHRGAAHRERVVRRSREELGVRRERVLERVVRKIEVILLVLEPPLDLPQASLEAAVGVRRGRATEGQPLTRLVEAVAVGEKVRERGLGGHLHVVGAPALGGEDGLLVRVDGERIARHVEERAELQRDVGLQRREGGRARAIAQRPDARDHNVHLAEGGDGADLAQLAAHPVDGGACFRCGGEGLDGGERRDVAAGLEVGERVRGLRGLADHLGVCRREVPRQRAELTAPLLETRHPELHGRLGLDAANARRLAGVVVSGGPSLRVGVEAVPRLAPRLVGVPRAGPLERRRDGGLLLVVPHLPHQRRRAGAHHRVPRRRCPLHADGGGDGDDGEPQRGERELQGAPAIALQVGEERLHAGVPRGGLAGQAAEQDTPQPRRHAVSPASGAHAAVRHGEHLRVEGGPLEGLLAVERLVERRAEGELIGAVIGGGARVLLRRHVAGRPHDRSHLGELCQRQERPARRGRRGRDEDGRDRRRRVAAVRDPEVGDLDRALLAHEDVVRLEVAMNDPGRVRGGEAATRGDVDAHALAPGVAAELPLPEGGPLRQLHRDEDAAVADADVVHRDHVRMRQARHGLRLAEEAGAHVVRRERRALQEELHRDLAIELGIVGRVHLAHRPAAQPADDDVAADPLDRR